MNDFTKRAALLVTELVERGATDDEVFDAICFSKSLMDISKAYKITTLSDKYSPDVRTAIETVKPEEMIDPEAHTFRFDPVTFAYPKKGDTFDIFWGVKLMLKGNKIKAIDWPNRNYIRYSSATEGFVYEDGTDVNFVPYLMNNNLYTIYEEVKQDDNT